jgi:hypothetical protein
VTVFGRFLEGGDVYKCAFGTAMAPAVFHPASETVTCVVPPVHLGAHEGEASSIPVSAWDVPFSVVILSHRHDRISHSALGPRPFRLYSPALALPKVRRIAPLTGPTTGGTRVFVRGRFARAVPYDCVFGEKHSPAVLVSEVWGDHGVGQDAPVFAQTGLDDMRNVSFGSSSIEEGNTTTAEGSVLLQLHEWSGLEHAPSVPAASNDVLRSASWLSGGRKRGMMTLGELERAVDELGSGEWRQADLYASLIQLARGPNVRRFSPHHVFPSGSASKEAPASGGGASHAESLHDAVHSSLLQMYTSIHGETPFEQVAHVPRPAAHSDIVGDDTLVCLSPLHVLPGAAEFRVVPAGWTKTSTVRFVSEADRKSAQGRSADAVVRREQAVAVLRSKLEAMMPPSQLPAAMGTASQLIADQLSDEDEEKRTLNAVRGVFTSKDEARSEFKPAADFGVPELPLLVESSGGAEFVYFAPVQAGAPFPVAVSADGDALVRVPVDIVPPLGVTPVCHFGPVRGGVNVRGVWDDAHQSVACIAPPSSALLTPGWRNQPLPPGLSFLPPRPPSSSPSSPSSLLQQDADSLSQFGSPHGGLKSIDPEEYTPSSSSLSEPREEDGFVHWSHPRDEAMAPADTRRLDQAGQLPAPTVKLAMARKSAQDLRRAISDLRRRGISDSSEAEEVLARVLKESGGAPLSPESADLLSRALESLANPDLVLDSTQLPGGGLLSANVTEPWDMVRSYNHTSEWLTQAGITTPEQVAALQSSLGPDLAAHTLDLKARAVRPLPSSLEMGRDAMQIADAAIARLSTALLPANTSLSLTESPEMARLAILERANRRVAAALQSPLWRVYHAGSDLSETPSTDLETQRTKTEALCNATIELLGLTCEGGASAAVLGRTMESSTIQAAASLGCPAQGPPSPSLLQRAISSQAPQLEHDRRLRWTVPPPVGALSDAGRGAGNRPLAGSPCDTAKFVCSTFGVFLREKMPSCGLRAFVPRAVPKPRPAPVSLSGVLGHPPLAVSVAISYNGEDWIAANGTVTMHDPGFVNLTALSQGQVVGTTTVAFSPTSGPAAGGTLLTITGLPTTLLLMVHPSVSRNDTNESSTDNSMSDWVLASRNVPLERLENTRVGCEMGLATLSGAIEWESIDARQGNEPASSDAPHSPLSSFLPLTFRIVCTVPPLHQLIADSPMPLSGVAVRPIVGGRPADVPFAYQTELFEAGATCSFPEAVARPIDPSVPSSQILNPPDVVGTRVPSLAASLWPFAAKCPPGTVVARNHMAFAAVYRPTAPVGLAAALPASAPLGSPLQLSIAMPASNPPPRDSILFVRVGKESVARFVPVATHVVTQSGIVTSDGGAGAVPGHRPRISPVSNLPTATEGIDPLAFVIVSAVGVLPADIMPGRWNLRVSWNGQAFSPLHAVQADPFDPRVGFDPAWPDWNQPPEPPSDKTGIVLGDSTSWLSTTSEHVPFIEKQFAEGASALWAMAQPGRGDTVASASSMFLHPLPHAFYVAPTSLSTNGGERAAVSVAMFHISPRAGPARGGTDVVAFGIGFAGGRDFMCRFGEVAVPAAFVHGWLDSDDPVDWNEDAAVAVSKWQALAAKEARQRLDSMQRLIQEGRTSWSFMQLRGASVASEARKPVSEGELAETHAMFSEDLEDAIARAVGDANAPPGWMDGMDATTWSGLKHSKLNWTLWELEADRMVQWKAHGESLGAMRREFVGDGSDGDGGVHPFEAYMRRREERQRQHPALLQHSAKQVNRRRSHLLQPGPGEPPGRHRIVCRAPPVRGGRSGSVPFAISMNGGLSWLTGVSESRRVNLPSHATLWEHGERTVGVFEYQPDLLPTHLAMDAPNLSPDGGAIVSVARSDLSRESLRQPPLARSAGDVPGGPLRPIAPARDAQFDPKVMLPHSVDVGAPHASIESLRSPLAAGWFASSVSGALRCRFGSSHPVKAVEVMGTAGPQGQVMCPSPSIRDLLVRLQGHTSQLRLKLMQLDSPGAATHTTLSRDEAARLLALSGWTAIATRTIAGQGQGQADEALAASASMVIVHAPAQVSVNGGADWTPVGQSTGSSLRLAQTLKLPTGGILFALTLDDPLVRELCAQGVSPAECQRLPAAPPLALPRFVPETVPFRGGSKVSVWNVLPAIDGITDALQLPRVGHEHLKVWCLFGDVPMEAAVSRIDGMTLGGGVVSCQSPAIETVAVATGGGGNVRYEFDHDASTSVRDGDADLVAARARRGDEGMGATVGDGKLFDRLQADALKRAGRFHDLWNHKSIVFDAEAALRGSLLQERAATRFVALTSQSAVSFSLLVTCEGNTSRSLLSTVEERARHDFPGLDKDADQLVKSGAIPERTVDNGEFGSNENSMLLLARLAPLPDSVGSSEVLRLAKSLSDKVPHRPFLHPAIAHPLASTIRFVPDHSVVASSMSVLSASSTTHSRLRVGNASSLVLAPLTNAPAALPLSIANAFDARHPLASEPPRSGGSTAQVVPNLAALQEPIALRVRVGNVVTRGTPLQGAQHGVVDTVLPAVPPGAYLLTSSLDGQHWQPLTSRPGGRSLLHRVTGQLVGKAERSGPGVLLSMSGDPDWRFGCVTVPPGWLTLLEKKERQARLDKIRFGGMNATTASTPRLQERELDPTSLDTLSRSDAFDEAFDSVFHASFLQELGIDNGEHTNTTKALLSTPRDLPGGQPSDAGAVRCFYRGPPARSELHLSGLKEDVVRRTLPGSGPWSSAVTSIHLFVEAVTDAPPPPISSDGVGPPREMPLPGNIPRVENDPRRVKPARLSLLRRQMQPVATSGTLWFVDIPLPVVDATHRGAGAGGMLWISHVDIKSLVSGNRGQWSFSTRDDNTGRGWEIASWKLPSTLSPDEILELGGASALAARYVLSARAARHLGSDVTLPPPLLPAFALSPHHRTLSHTIRELQQLSLLQLSSHIRHDVSHRLAGSPSGVPRVYAPSTIGLRGGTLFAPLSNAAFTTRYMRAKMEHTRKAEDPTPQAGLRRDGAMAKRLGRSLVALTIDVPLPPSSDPSSELSQTLDESLLPSLHINGQDIPQSPQGSLPPGLTTGATMDSLPGFSRAQPRANIFPVGAHASAAGGMAGSKRLAWGGIAAPLSFYAAGVDTMTVVLPAHWGSHEDDLDQATKPPVEADILSEDDAGIPSAVSFVTPELSPSVIMPPSVPGRAERANPLHRAVVQVGFQSSVLSLYLGERLFSAIPPSIDANPAAKPRVDGSNSRPVLSKLADDARVLFQSSTIAWSSEGDAVCDLDMRVFSPQRPVKVPVVPTSPKAVTARPIRPPEFLVMRLVPHSMANTPQPFPLSLAARRVFDNVIVQDVESSTGIAAHRLSVVSADPATGVIVLRCVDALDDAGPLCTVGKAALASAVANTASPLHQGVAGFNADPLFPGGDAIAVQGRVAVLPGACSDPSKLSEKDCLGDGQCSCREVRRNDRSECEMYPSLSGQSCTFVPDNSWTPGPRVVRFAGCDDPRYGSKEACLAAGECSNPQHKTRDACLAPGVCVPPKRMRDDKMNTVGRPVFDFTEFRTRQECIDPSKRKPFKGRCRTPDGGDAIYPCFRHTDKLTCEKPETRTPLPASKVCVRRKNGPAYDYAQFKDQKSCEKPETRNCQAMVRRYQALFENPLSSGTSRPFFFTQLASHPLFDVLEGKSTPLRRLPDPKFVPPLGFPGAVSEGGSEGAIEWTLPPGTADVAGSVPAAVVKAVFGQRRSEVFDPSGLEGVRRVEGQYDTDSTGDIQNEQRSTGLDDVDSSGGAALPPKPSESKGPSGPSKPVTKDGFDCGPAGVWAASDSLLAKGAVCKWDDLSDGAPCRFNTPPPCLPDLDRDELERQRDKEPGEWVSPNEFKSKNDWKEDGKMSEKPCPCEWPKSPESKFHLKKCNWWQCGPPSQSASADGQVDFYRQKQPNDMVSDYNAFIKVGGNKLWMTIDSSTSTSWVMSMACFTDGCQQVKIFAGAFIPAIPPGPVPIDLLEAGIFQILSMIGLNGHTLVSGGTSVMGAPVIVGILDLGTINPMSFNHSGTIGLAYWEDNWPWQLLILDPMLSIMDFQRCGNTFYPIPMVPVPIPKGFQMWAIPPVFPGGVTAKVAFFFGDTGGCYFVNGAPGQFTRGSMTTLMIMPLPGIKFLTPSWMFMVTGVKVGKVTVKPCLIPALCRGVFKTGIFSTTGPLIPTLVILEGAAAPLTCEHLEILPELKFSFMGSNFPLARQDYTILGWSYDSVQCMTAFTPAAQLIPGFDLWQFGDSFVRAYYLSLQIQPLKMAKLGPSAQPFYEKNGCSGTSGVGPVAKYKKEMEMTMGKKGSDAKNEAKRERGSTEGDMFWKRRQNWEDDLKGRKANADDSYRASSMSDECGPAPPGGGGGPRFRTLGGRCVPSKHHAELSDFDKHHSRMREMLDVHREKIEGWKRGEYHGANGEDDTDAWVDGAGPNSEVESASEQVFGEMLRNDEEPAAGATLVALQTAARTRLRGQRGQAVLGPESDTVMQQQGKIIAAEVATGSPQKSVDLERPLSGAGDATSVDSRFLTGSELVDTLGYVSLREAVGAEGIHRALQGAFDVDSLLMGVAPPPPIPAGDDPPEPLHESVDVDQDFVFDKIGWPNVTVARAGVMRLFRQARCSQPNDLPTCHGIVVAAANATFNASIPWMVQRRLDAMSGGLWSLPADVREWLMSQTRVTAPHLHSDADRLVSLDSDATEKARSWLKLQRAIAFVEAQAFHERRRRERTERGMEPPESLLPPVKGIRQALDGYGPAVPGEEGWDEALAHTDLKEEERRASQAERASSDNDNGKAWAPHEDPYYRALGYGKASCAHKHPEFNPKSRISDRHGLSYTHGGDLIGCTAEGEPVILPTVLSEISTSDQRAEMIRNMSAIMKHIERAMNISEAETRLYWRGESVEFELREARRWLVRYKRQIEQAQETAQLHKILSRLHKEQLRSYIMRQSTDPAQMLVMMRMALARMGDGSVLDIAAPSDFHGNDAGATLERMSSSNGNLRARGGPQWKDPRGHSKRVVNTEANPWDVAEETRHRSAPEDSLWAAGGGLYPFVDTPEISAMEARAAQEAAEEARQALHEAELDKSGEAVKFLNQLLDTAQGLRRGRESREDGSMVAKLERDATGQWKLVEPNAPPSEGEAAVFLDLGGGKVRNPRTLDEGSLSRVALLESLELLHEMHAEALDEHVASLSRQIAAVEADIQSREEQHERGELEDW